MHCLQDHENLQLKLEQVASKETAESEKPVGKDESLPNLEAPLQLSDNVALQEMKETYEQTLSEIQNVGNQTFH